MLHEIGEDAAISSVDCCGVERPAGKTSGGVDDAEYIEVMIAGDDNRVRLVEGLVFGE